MFKEIFIKILQQFFSGGVIVGKEFVMENSLIPKQEVGNQLDLLSTKRYVTIEEAIVFFEIVKTRLLNVNHWDEICNVPSSVFKLINVKGQEIAGLIQKDDFIRINIPGPGTKAGEGFDWVKVMVVAEEKFEQGELLSITVKPSHHPLRANSETAHFFSSRASSTFQVKRKGNILYAAVHGRNELPNNKTAAFIDNLRNTVVGWSAKIGFSYPQWKGLVDGLLKS